ncbi:putative DMT superfamily transporter inner membrane protein [Vibrio ruber DSM 16370]|uniref:Putative DMT superfamily transporter inner membrane protein n=1 Tax=Vibrio ruber (strain DSM 16370 / JCM 11486 / BCRC 17186 / CECT 7878 / LMG 23124 / VR1) TaxID=1123498 RepID=A0A1R4LF50_VIBR1|nr:DMT family transporter [Vibrio ruber]SJN55039.1 putative DMT superfamily transporter inner membrane protein [Vibrio ruber DSM 16370]
MNIILALVATFLWGTTYAVTQATLPGWPPLLLGVLRALPAGLVLLAIKPTFPDKGTWKVLLITGLVNIAIFFCCIFVMALTLPSAISSVGMMSVPVFAMLVQWIVMKQRPSVIQIISGLALLGFAALLFDPGRLNLSLLGLLAMLIGILCLICGSTLTQMLSQKLAWWCVLTWQLILGGLALLFITLVHASYEPSHYMNAWQHLSGKNLLGLFWLCILNTAVAYSFCVWALKHISVVEFTFAGVANPVAGILCGLILVGESYTLIQYGLMFGMIVMSLFPQFIKSYQKYRDVSKKHLQPLSEK